MNIEEVVEKIRKCIRLASGGATEGERAAAANRAKALAAAHGLDIDGFDSRGFNSLGVHRNGSRYDDDGYDVALAHEYRWTVTMSRSWSGSSGGPRTFVSRCCCMW